jgi:O-methyltransferase involved in polyketide biosynthesis
MKSSESLSGVGETALGAAMMRARESLRPDRLFDDPYADAFVAAAPEAFADGPADSDNGALAALEAAFSSAVVVRTRFYDDYLLAACAAGCRQVVLLAAGLDTRAFRLNWPDRVRLFELDLPEVLAFKEGVLARRRAAPRCARTALPVDLREDWPAQLTDAGFEPSHIAVEGRPERERAGLAAAAGLAGPDRRPRDPRRHVRTTGAGRLHRRLPDRRTPQPAMTPSSRP